MHFTRKIHLSRRKEDPWGNWCGPGGFTHHEDLEYQRGGPQNRPLKILRQSQLDFFEDVVNSFRLYSSLYKLDYELYYVSVFCSSHQWCSFSFFQRRDKTQERLSVVPPSFSDDSRRAQSGYTGRKTQRGFSRDIFLSNPLTHPSTICGWCANFL